MQLWKWKCFGSQLSHGEWNRQDQAVTQIQPLNSTTRLKRLMWVGGGYTVWNCLEMKMSLRFFMLDNYLCFWRVGGSCHSGHFGSRVTAPGDLIFHTHPPNWYYRLRSKRCSFENENALGHSWVMVNGIAKTKLWHRSNLWTQPPAWKDWCGWVVDTLFGIVIYFLTHLLSYHTYMPQTL